MNLRARLSASIQWGSLKTRLTLFTLAIVLLGFWSLAFYSNRILREDMQAQLSDQQYSTVSLLAAEIKHEIDDRFAALGMVAASISPAVMGDAAALQRLLEQRPMFGNLFNGGVLALGTDGTAIAEIPARTERIGTNYLDVDTISAALRDGESIVGRPLMGKKLKAPVFGMTVPIRDAQGRVIGALSGVTRLGAPNFLDRIMGGRYGKSGGYMLVSKQHRLIVTSTDKRMVMAALPPTGGDALRDRFLGGYEGTGIAINPMGEEVLASARGIPGADWFLGVALPTAEAFAPIRAVQQRTLIVAIILTLLAGGLSWWLLRRQLSPLLAALKELSRLSADQSLRPLPVTRQDEIGELIGGFNRLLEILAQREADLRQSEERLNEAQGIAHLGNWTIYLTSGQLIFTHELFRLLEIAPDPALATYENFLAAVHPDDVEAVKATYTRALKTRQPTELTHRLRMRDGRVKWVLERFVVSFDSAGAPLRAHGTVLDITERKEAEERRLSEARQQRDTLVREVHHRIKNHLQGLAGLLENELGRQAEQNPRLATAISQVYAIATVHGLQASSADEAVRLCDSVRNICKAVSSLSQRPVAFHIEGEDSAFEAVRVDSDEAVPVALVLNELILNAVKHSAAGGRDPWVTLSADGVSAQVSIGNVPKAAPQFDLDNGQSCGMGLRLVRSLLPQRGAELSRELDAEGLMITRLKLAEPVVRPAR